MTLYDAPYLSEAEHTILDHTGLVGVPQGGAYVPGTDWLYVEGDWNGQQTLIAQAAKVPTTLTFGTPLIEGDAFVLGTKSIQVVEGTRVRGKIGIDVYQQPAALAAIVVTIREYTADVGGSAVDVGGTDKGFGNVISYPPIPLFPAPAGAPWFEIPFELSVTPGNWVRVIAGAYASNVVVDSFGGMFIERIA